MKRVLLAALVLLAGCDQRDMYSQPRESNWNRDPFFANDAAMRPMVPGTVSPDEVNLPVAQPASADMAMLQRGQQRFDIFCAPCHGRSGDGEGMIVERGFPRPPSLYSARLVKAKAKLFYDTITYGHGAMYSYADRVSPADRWAIAAYIRALQRSQDTPRDALSPQDLAALEGKP